MQELSACRVRAPEPSVAITRRLDMSMAGAPARALNLRGCALPRRGGCAGPSRPATESIPFIPDKRIEAKERPKRN